MGYSSNYSGMGLSDRSDVAKFNYAKCMTYYDKQTCDAKRECARYCADDFESPACQNRIIQYEVLGGGGCGCSCRGLKANPQGGYGNIIPAQVGRSNTVSGMNGLNESFLESLGTVGNLAILGLAIYGGYALAKKM